MTRPGVQFKALAGVATLAPPMLDGSGAPGEAMVRATVATFGKVDADGDLTVPGFFGRQSVLMVPVHDWQHVPIGKGLLYENGDQAVVDLKMNMAIPAARAWYEALAFDLANPPPLQQWSYSYTVKAGGSFEGTFGGRRVRFLQPRPDGSPGAEIQEVSPVLMGAGVETSTLQVGESADVDQDPDMAREYARFVRSTMEAA